MKSARSDDDLNDIGILFDLDGTLVDTAGDLVAATNHVLAHDGLPTLAVEHGRHMAGVSAKTMIDAAFRAAGRSLSAEDMPSRLERFLDYYTAHIDAHSALFPDARTTIEALKRCGAKLAVCTNKREALAIDLLERLHVVDMFETIVGGDTAMRPKPDPAPALLCLERLQVSNAVFIGDSDTDLCTAKAAALPFIAADFGYGPLDKLGPDAVTFSHYSALPSLINNAMGA
ncbi:MAG: HAD family hydrolase [Parvularculaceae bacterium]|nr:MAG: HAD family hydrolase [Parvularculaceae bacterium]